MGAQQPLPTKGFDFANVTVTWGKFNLAGGLDSIKVSRSEDTWSYHIAADGTVTRVKNNNRMGGIELVYGQNAVALDILSSQAQLDEASGTAVYAIEVKDGSGRSIATAPGAWIKKPSDVSYAKEDTQLTWQIDCDQLTHFIGGLN